MHQHLARAVCCAGDRIVHNDSPDTRAALDEPVYAVVRLPPPDMIMPFLSKSPTSWGGVLSSTVCIASSMRFIGSTKASISSVELTCTVLGRAV